MTPLNQQHTDTFSKVVHDINRTMNEPPSPQRIGSAIDLSIDKEASETEAIQLLSGVSIILDYLNACNTVAELADIKHRAFTWCLNYYGTVFYNRHKPEVVIEAHPNLFDVEMPSILRLDSSPGNDDDGAMEQNKDDSEIADQSSQKSPFPNYSEPVLLNDQLMYHLLEFHDAEVAMQDLAADDRMIRRRQHPFNIHIAAMDLKESSIIFHIPEIMCNLSMLSSLALAKREKDDAPAAVAGKKSTASSLIDIDIPQEDVDQVMTDYQAESTKTNGAWGVLSNIIRA